IAADKDDPAYPTDADRPLTKEGAKKTRAAAEGLKRLGLEFDGILTSPWLRASQTAQIAAKVLRMEDRLENLPELEGDRSVDDLLKALGNASGSKLLLVGHQPQMGETISRLVCADGHADVDLKKSGAAAVEVDNVAAPTTGRLLW